MRATIAVLVAAAACSSSSHNNPAPKPDASNGSGANCAALTSGISDFQPTVDSTPPGFPEAPSGLQLCGADSNMPTGPVQEWYLAGPDTMDQVFTYYQTQLGAQGYTVADPVTQAGGNTKIVFTKAAVAGSLVFNSIQLFVLVTFPS